MVGVIFAMFLTIPTYFIWNALAPTYFYFLPEVYRHIPFWNMMGLLLLFAFARALIFPQHEKIKHHEWKWKAHKG